MTITIGEKIEYKLIVTGDLSGDGQLTMQDISLMQLHIVKLKTLEGIYEKSADMNGDGSIRVSDLSMICILRVGL